MTGPIDSERDKTLADTQIPVEEQTGTKHPNQLSPLGCAVYANRRPGWFSSLGSVVPADLELSTRTRSLPAQTSLFTQGDDARSLCLTFSGYLKLTADRPEDRHMIVRVAGSRFALGLYPVLSHGVYEVNAESFTPAQLRPVERDQS